MRRLAATGVPKLYARNGLTGAERCIPDRIAFSAGA